MLREGKFIKDNINRWEKYEIPTENPDELAERFVNLVDDLSYSKTFYPGSQTTKYINSIAAKQYLSIFKNKKEDYKRIFDVWTIDIPLIVAENKKLFRWIFIFFCCTVALGVYASYNQPSFIRSFLGDGYVDMTEKNIANGTPFNVYASEDSFEMFIRIAANNISVAFKTFVSGLGFGLLTLGMLFYNGVLLGAFESIFFQHHLGIASILTIMIHGTLELWSILVAGVAGMMMGNAILYPGTYTRLQALQKQAKKATKLILSIVPNFILAAIFESYVTRHSDISIWLNALILVCFVVLISWYYGYYPSVVAKKMQAKGGREV